MDLLEKKESAGLKKSIVSKTGHLEKAQRKRSKESFKISANGVGRSSKRRKRSLSRPESHKVKRLHEHAGLHSSVSKSHPITGKEKKLSQGLAVNILTQSSGDSVNSVASFSNGLRGKQNKKNLPRSWEVRESKLQAVKSQNASANAEAEKQVIKEIKQSKPAPKSAVAKPILHLGDSQSSPAINTGSKKKKKKKKKGSEQTDDSDMQSTKGTNFFLQKKKYVSNQTKVLQSLGNTGNASGIGKASQKKEKKAQQKQAKSGNLKQLDNENALKTTEIQTDKSLGKVGVHNGKNLGKGDVQGGKKLGKKDAKTNDSYPLKGKALKQRLASIIKTISRLHEQRKISAVLLLKTKNTEKINKIEERFRKISEKIGKFEGELQALKYAKVNTSIAVAKNVATGQSDESAPTGEFVGMPLEEIAPKRKEERHVALKDYLENQLKSSRFRWLNENLYSSSSGDAQEYFQEDPESFKAYHQGYAEQVAKWPANPLDSIIKNLKSLPKGTVVADLGCGEAKLAACLPHLTVHSLDLVALKPEVIACDMAHCPLLRSSVDIVVFCLSLMGTNVGDFLLEANRILKTSGALEIAEVHSRFDAIDDFIQNVDKFGFDFKRKSLTDMFFFVTFSKRQDVNKSGKLPEFHLKPCLYKKR